MLVFVVAKNVRDELIVPSGLAFRAGLAIAWAEALSLLAVIVAQLNSLSKNSIAPQNSRALYQGKINGALQAAEKLNRATEFESFVPGHDFSRAITAI